MFSTRIFFSILASNVSLASRDNKLTKSIKNVFCTIYQWQFEVFKFIWFLYLINEIVKIRSLKAGARSYRMIRFNTSNSSHDKKLNFQFMNEKNCSSQDSFEKCKTKTCTRRQSRALSTCALLFCFHFDSLYLNTEIYRCQVGELDWTRIVSNVNWKLDQPNGKWLDWIKSKSFSDNNRTVNIVSVSDIRRTIS